MTALDSAWPTTLEGRAYVGRRALDGRWRVVIGDQPILAPDARRLARTLLRDAFDGHRVREDLVDAFAAWLPAGAGRFDARPGRRRRHPSPARAAPEHAGATAPSPATARSASAPTASERATPAGSTSRRAPAGEPEPAAAARASSRRAQGARDTPQPNVRLASAEPPTGACHPEGAPHVG